VKTEKYRKSLFKIDELTLLLLHTICILECFVAVSAEAACHPNYSTFSKRYCVLYPDCRFESSHQLNFYVEKQGWTTMYAGYTTLWHYSMFSHVVTY